MYIFKKNILHVYINIWYTFYEYKYIHVNIFKIYAVCECILHKQHKKIKWLVPKQGNNTILQESDREREAGRL